MFEHLFVVNGIRGEFIFIYSFDLVIRLVKKLSSLDVNQPDLLLLYIKLFLQGNLPLL